MCVVSMVGDHYQELIPRRWPNVVPAYTDTGVDVVELKRRIDMMEAENSKQLEDLRRTIEDLLVKAKQYDVDNAEPDCEVDEKVALLKAIAATLGVDLKEVFG